MGPVDTGDVALLGAAAGVGAALVGAGGAVLAARLTGRNQSKSQHVHWRRQVQRDAYVAFLGCFADFEGFGRAAGERRLTRRDIPPGSADQFRGLVHDIRKAVLVVELEGPPAVAESAKAVELRLAEWQGTLHLEELLRVQDRQRQTDLPSSDELRLEVNAAITHFKRIASAALNASDGALETNATDL